VIAMFATTYYIAGTELRLMAEMESAVRPTAEAEVAVIERYAQHGGWPHRTVSLFVLENLSALERQLRAMPDVSAASLASLGDRPLVNLYDLADPSACRIFMNRQAMIAQEYWDDDVALRGLLAHEHAHPLAENLTTRSSRQLRVVVQAAAGRAFERAQPLLLALCDKLCVLAPRELCTNELAIARGFAAEMLHLNRSNLRNAQQSIAGRAHVRQMLGQEIAKAALNDQEVVQLLLIGDLTGYLDLALEIAPFYRAGLPADARELEATLEVHVFPVLQPVVAQVYRALCGLYQALEPGMQPAALAAWSRRVLSTLTGALADEGLRLQADITYDGDSGSLSAQAVNDHV
jgi:hypothetical protein